MNETQEKKSLSESDIEDVIQSEEYMKIGKKTTLCLLTLKNGFEITGTSSCVSAKMYSSEIGKRLAREKAKDTIWLCEGYVLQKLLA